MSGVGDSGGDGSASGEGVSRSEYSGTRGGGGLLRVAGVAGGAGGAGAAVSAGSGGVASVKRSRSCVCVSIRQHT